MKVDTSRCAHDVTNISQNGILIPVFIPQGSVVNINKDVSFEAE
jgi:hypothetical protein